MLENVNTTDEGKCILKNDNNRFGKIRKMIVASVMALGVIVAVPVAAAPAAQAASTSCGTSWMYTTNTGGYKHANRKIVKRDERQNCKVTHNSFEKVVLGKKDYSYNKDTGWYDYSTYNISTGKRVAFSRTNIWYSVFWHPTKDKYAGDKFWNNLPIAG